MRLLHGAPGPPPSTRPALRGCRAPHGLPAVPRRHPRHRRPRRAAVPRRPALDPRRLPGRRRVLRREWLPHHVAARRGAPRDDVDGSPPVLAAASQAPPAGVVRHVDRHLLLRRGVRARRPLPPAHRRRRRGDVLDELVAHRQQPELLRSARPPAAAAPPVVVGGGGAVVPPVAAGVRGDHQPRGRAGAKPRPSRPPRGAGVDGVAGHRVRPRSRRLSRLLRHRHPRRGPPHRRGSRDGVDALAVAGRGTLAPSRPRRRGVGGTGAARARDAALGGGLDVPVPRRLLPRVAAVDRGGRGVGAPRSRDAAAPPCRCRSCAGSDHAATACTCGTGRCSWSPASRTTRGWTSGPGSCCASA